MNHHRRKLLVKNLLLTLKGYSFIPKKNNSKAAIVIMFDNKMLHGGLLDRIKGIVAAKMIADELQYDFKIYVNKKTFNLLAYLKLKDPNVAMPEDQLQYNIWTSKPVLFYNTLDATKQEVLNLFSNRHKQYHFYCNLNLLKAFYPALTEEEWNRKWRDYFNQLFYFDDYFVDTANRLFKTQNIVGFHLRFLSLLGDEVEGTKVLPDNEKIALTEGCVQRIGEIIGSSSAEQFLVVSDSTTFLHSLQQMTGPQSANIVILEGSIAHIDFVHDEEVLKKAILNFYLLCRCKQVYQIIGNSMHRSQFCLYAAVLSGGKYIISRLLEKNQRR